VYNPLPDGYGGRVTTYTDLGNVFIEVLPQTSSHELIQGNIDADEQAVWRIWDRDDFPGEMSKDYRFNYNGRQWIIHSVIDINRRRREIELLVYSITEGVDDAPTWDNIPAQVAPPATDQIVLSISDYLNTSYDIVEMVVTATPLSGTVSTTVDLAGDTLTINELFPGSDVILLTATDPLGRQVSTYLAVTFEIAVSGYDKPVITVSEVLGTDEILVAWNGTILDGNWTVDYNGDTVTVPFTQYSVLLTSLTPDTEYTITVQGEDTGSNVTPVSDPVTVTTEAAVVPYPWIYPGTEFTSLLPPNKDFNQAGLLIDNDSALDGVTVDGNYQGFMFSYRTLNGTYGVSLKDQTSGAVRHAIKNDTSNEVQITMNGSNNIQPLSNYIPAVLGASFMVLFELRPVSGNKFQAWVHPIWEGALGETVPSSGPVLMQEWTVNDANKNWDMMCEANPNNRYMFLHRVIKDNDQLFN
jgi:SPP1 family predicted phage head-tail adaptor